MTTPEEAFGSGLKWTEDWDLEVNSYGSFEAISGVDNLRQVISRGVTERLNDELGENIDVNTLTEIGVAFRRVVLRHNAVDNVSNIRVEKTDDDTVSIEADVVTPIDEVHIGVTLP